jgi:Fe-S cluster assembly iron-binding protein IscA
VDFIVHLKRLSMIEINDEVKKEFKAVLDRNPGKFLRIDVEGDGCAGPYFAISLVEPDPTENLLEIKGIKLIVPDAVLRYSKVTTINLRLNPEGKEL